MMTKIETQAMDAVIGIHREMKKANETDWEKRRYEIAKELFLHGVKTSLNSVKMMQKTPLNGRIYSFLN